MSNEMNVTDNRTPQPDSPALTHQVNTAPGKGGFLWGVVATGVVVILLIMSCTLGYFSRPLINRPPPTPTFAGRLIQPPTIQDVQRMAELSTIRYTLTAEVSDLRVPDDFRQQLGIKEEMLLLAYGEVAAGFDLGKLRDDDIWVDGTRIQIHLPAPEILYSRLDTERTRVIYYSKSLFVRRDVSMEGRIREEAEKAIREAALEGDLLEQASQHGELFFSNWLRSMGFTEVRVIVG
jgi:hypothetical protein